jgi:hypothetical protein
MQNGINLYILMPAFVIPGSTGGALVLEAAFLSQSAGRSVIGMDD